MLGFIQQNQGILMVFFFALAALCLAAATFFAILMRRAEKKADQRLKQARADITDMTILFQTMRDIIGQQKSLAKEFNEELEHKMEQVKHILNQGMEKNKQLYDKQQRIAAELEEARAEIGDLFRQLAQAPNTPATPPPQNSTSANGPAKRAAAPPPAPGSASAARPGPTVVNRTPAPGPRPEPTVVNRTPAPEPAPAPARPTPKPPAPRPALSMDARDFPAEPKEHLVRTKPTPEPREKGPAGISAEDAERLSDTGVTKSPFTSWIAEDFTPKEPPERKPAPPPGTPDPAEKGPSNGDAAREAFRALLNMPAAPEPDPGPLDVMPKGTGASAAGQSDTAPDEAGLSAPLQQRVLEYSEAGMTVAQVSRELGIGKGEVRLMLSLAKQQSPPRI